MEKLNTKGETPIRHIRMSDDLWHALERIAKKPGIERTPGFLVRQAIVEFIDRHRAAEQAAKATE